MAWMMTLMCVAVYSAFTASQLGIKYTVCLLVTALVVGMSAQQKCCLSNAGY